MHNRLPRIAAAVIAAGGWCFSAAGQEQEPGLLERVTSAPDMTRANQLAAKSFTETAAMAIEPSTLASRTALDAKAFGTGSFDQTRTFLGIRNPWFGKKVVETDAVAPDLRNPFTARDFATEAAPSDDRASFVESNEKADVPDNVEIRTSPIEGSAQGSLDLMSEGMKRELTIDEVREILNKSR